ncbi:efflux RND transporter permease subunit [Paenibacillus sp. HN-1]|uniref:efflux RND transporter permease subunit n=1 Tax=Paenibacillus TaxID=44249 RepID=UPI001CA8F591|nr:MULTISPECIES: efflux RND transporter permease subunit [Paenibacillus]MBY9079341.1 efflux RND transporter permease subunit [Paenibacillus sp. CGMCC 1.18879]MBY9087724.1 efflux RND transporter permease subunit [Paenibacillus sinensis]
MNWLTKFSLKNSTAVVILCLLVLGYGLYSTMQIKQETLPAMELPTVFVQVTQPGASTEEIESGVTKPIEDSIKGLKNYDSLTSTSAENAANIVVQFPFGSDMDKLTGEVEAAVAKIDIPAGANATVQRLSLSGQAIYEAAIFSDKLDSAALEEKLQNEIVPQLQKLEGVSSVELKGTTSEHLEIVVDKDKAAQKGITLGAIRSALQSLNYAMPLGSASVDETTIPIKLSGQITSLKQIENLRLGTGDGVVLLSDLAEIKTISTQDEITRYNGEPSYLLDVMKTQDANTASVTDEVKSLLDDYEKSGELGVHIVSDQGENVKESISGFIHEGLFGTLFCMITIFLFLRNIRATLISIISLPISVFATIAFMNQLGYTLNIMTLGGIAVSVGRIIDDSIVVIENIYRWKQSKGDELRGKELALKATREVMGAVASSTIAMVVVFAPLIFVGGMIGVVFRPFALAVVISILTSLFVAAMLIPIMGGKFFNRVKPHKEGGRLSKFFEKTIRGALKRKVTVLGLSILLLVGSVCLVPLLGISFLPSESVPSASVEIVLPAKSTLDETDKVGSKVENYLKELPSTESYEISIGGSQNSKLGSAANKNKAEASVIFVDGTDLDQMIDQMNSEIPSLVSAEVPGTTVEVKSNEVGLTSGNNVAVNIYSNNPDEIAAVAKNVEEVMKHNGDLKDVTNNMNEVTPKWVITLNQQGIDLNVNPSLITQLVGEQLKPIDAGAYTIDSENREITLTYQQPIASLSELKNIQVPTAGGVKTLSDVANVSEESAWIQVNHDDGRMYAEVSATIKDEDAVQSVTKQVKEDVQSLALPSGVEVNFGGGLEMIGEGFSSLIIAMVVAIGLVFLVMSMTFGGLITPLIILSSLIFIPVGSLSALLITGESLSISAMIGMLMLVGIVVTNAVVLLDRVEKNRISGIPIREAIVEASMTRLRPILMTAFATMLSLMPVAMSSGSSTSLISGGLAITVIGGLFSSTLLTLIVVPVIYELAWRKRKVKEIETF